MLNAEETSHAQPTNLQSLPGKAGAHAAAASLAPQDFTTSSVLNSGEAHGQTVTATTRLSEGTSPASATPASGALSPAMQQLQWRVTNSSMELRAARGESMSVVIRPDAHTEMVLHVKLHQGLVNVEAHMQRGDGTSLQAQWGQLQQNLSQQGIRLHALQAQDPAPDASARDFSRSSFSDERPAPRDQDNATAEPTPAPATRRTSAAVRTATGSTSGSASRNSNQWESWA